MTAAAANIVKFDPSEQRDQHGRWTRAAGAVAHRSLRIAAHVHQLHGAAMAASSAPTAIAAIPHVAHAANIVDALLTDLAALPPEARQLGDETVHKLRIARAALLKLKARLQRGEQ
jgi:hypothetical protein